MKTLNCTNLTKEIESLLNDGYRLDMIMPADDPCEAIVSKDADRIRLSTGRNPHSEIRNPQSEGRAGMEYRDLIPDRVGGKLIASHIRLTAGGEVPDYVHYHKLQFQIIYCKSGWVRVVYEDQGPPFVMNAGDCVLQPPEIRHRVLESSAGAEVIELSSPAIHETWVEHDLELPTAELKPDHVYRDQRFVLHRASATPPDIVDGCSITDTAIEEATQGYGRVRIVRLSAGAVYHLQRSGEFLFVYVLSGEIRQQGSKSNLQTDEHLLLALSSESFTITAIEDSEVLEVVLLEI